MIVFVTAALVGQLVDRVGPRRVAIPGYAAFCLAVMALGLAGSSVWTWYLIWGLLGIAQAFANLRAVLAAHEMTVANIVKTTAFLTDRELLASYRQARGALFGDNPPPASTLLFVAGLADPSWVVEIEAEAVA